MVDIQPQATKPISDDQELAKVLAGVSEQANNNPESNATPPIAAPESSPSDSDLPTPSEPVASATPEPEAAPIGYNPPTTDNNSAPAEPSHDEPATPPTTPTPDQQPSPDPTPPQPTQASGSLEGIKKDALNDLRPLVDKLDLEPEEKFDTYLLLLRSTDDKELIAPAHAAAKAIADESRRAKALLDIIKEIDFLSNPQ